MWKQGEKAQDQLQTSGKKKKKTHTNNPRTPLPSFPQDAQIFKRTQGGRSWRWNQQQTKQTEICIAGGKIEADGEFLNCLASDITSSQRAESNHNIS